MPRPTEQSPLGYPGVKVPLTVVNSVFYSHKQSHCYLCQFCPISYLYDEFVKVELNGSSVALKNDCYHTCPDCETARISLISSKKTAAPEGKIQGLKINI